VSPPANRRAGLVRWLPAIAWMAVIFMLSSVSGLRVSDDVSVDRPLRGLAHLCSYALLAALLLYALGGRQRPATRHLALAYGLCLAFGLSDEIHQAFVPDRSGRIEDLMIDAIGAAGGLVLGYLGLMLWSRGSRGGPADDPASR
jgi:VanZ family protein